WYLMCCTSCPTCAAPGVPGTARARQGHLDGRDQPPGGAADRRRHAPSSGTWSTRRLPAGTCDLGRSPALMRAARIFEDLSLRVDEAPDPAPGPGEVLVRVHAAGVCGTDLHIIDGMIKPDPYPMTIGHEAAGVVEVAGEGAGSVPGDRVAVYNKLYCGYCEQCLTGRHNICDNEPGQLGFNMDGGDAEYVVVPARNLVPVPEAVDFATAAVLSCAGMTAVHAVRLSSLRLGQTAVVDGIGGVGILVVQAARHAGARVIAVADSEDKRRFALSHGAADALVIAQADDYANLPGAVREL